MKKKSSCFFDKWSKLYFGFDDQHEIRKPLKLKSLKTDSTTQVTSHQNGSIS